MISRSDTCTPEELKAVLVEAAKISKPVFAISMFDDESLLSVKKLLTTVAQEKKLNTNI
jgi:hypothetical protein